MLLGVAAGLIVLLVGAGSVQWSPRRRRTRSGQCHARGARRHVPSRCRRRSATSPPSSPPKRTDGGPTTRARARGSRACSRRGRIPRHRRRGVERERVRKLHPGHGRRPRRHDRRGCRDPGCRNRRRDPGAGPRVRSRSGHPAPLVEVSGDGRVGAVLWSAHAQPVSSERDSIPRVASWCSISNTPSAFGARSASTSEGVRSP